MEDYIKSIVFEAFINLLLDKKLQENQEKIQTHHSTEDRVNQIIKEEKLKNEIKETLKQ